MSLQPVSIVHRAVLDMSSLLEPLIIGKTLALRNRVSMASMTRNRCIDDFKPGPEVIKHYAERARDGVGLIVTEGTLIDWAGMSWQNIPYMMTEDHCEAWRKVVEAVHNEGGIIFMQAWHAGEFVSFPGWHSTWGANFLRNRPMSKRSDASVERYWATRVGPIANKGRRWQIS